MGSDFDARRQCDRCTYDYLLPVPCLRLPAKATPSSEEEEEEEVAVASCDHHIALVTAFQTTHPHRPSAAPLPQPSLTLPLASSTQQ